MNFLKRVFTIIILLFFGVFNNSEASNLEPDSIEVNNYKKETILLVDVIQPLLFGKAGIAIGRRNLKQENIFYLNYVFGRGVLPTTAFRIKTEGNNNGSNRYTSRVGIDLGMQLKTRNKLLSKPYKEYIKDFKSKSRFYSGTWFEASYKIGDRPLYYYSPASSYRLLELKVGGMVGWSFNNSNSNLLFDLNLGVGIGGGWASIEDEAISNMFYSAPANSYNVNSLLLLYKIGFQIGFKL